MGLPYLDTGMLYRAVGRRVLDGAGDPADAAVAEAAAKTLTDADLRRDDLRGPVADAAASAVAAIPAVRAALLNFQRGFATRHGAVLDGRDTGTVIFPDAAAKIFVTADLDVRAERRWAELRAGGTEVDLATVRQDMHRRDTQDSKRNVAPLHPAKDALRLDTTTLDPEKAYQMAMDYIRIRFPLP